MLASCGQVYGVWKPNRYPVLSVSGDLAFSLSMRLVPLLSVGYVLNCLVGEGKSDTNIIDLPNRFN